MTNYLPYSFSLGTVYPFISNLVGKMGKSDQICKRTYEKYTQQQFTHIFIYSSILPKTGTEAS